MSDEGTQEPRIDKRSFLVERALDEERWERSVLERIAARRRTEADDGGMDRERLERWTLLMAEALGATWSHGATGSSRLWPSRLQTTSGSTTPST